MQNMLCMEIPVFHPIYKKWKTYGYKGEKERENLQEALNNATGGYCMYCYSRIKVDGKNFGQLEHAIEKNNSTLLIECIPDIGIACSKCNSSFKKTGEKTRKIDQTIIAQFEQRSRCGKGHRKQCSIPCHALRDLQKYYSEMSDAEILLQPMNVQAATGKFLQLQYSVLKMEFEPKEDVQNPLTDKEKQFVRLHIKRFHLNDPKYRTTQLRDFIAMVIDNEGKFPAYEYNNLVVQLFAEQLRTLQKEECLKICKKIYPILFLIG